MNSEFFFSKTSCLTKAEEPSLPYYLPIAGGRIIGFIPFPRVSVLCEMQSVSSRIWTRVTVSISYHYNHYTTGLSWLMTVPWKQTKEEAIHWIFTSHPNVYVNSACFDPLLYSSSLYILLQKEKKRNRLYF